jgi:hypothetical protein
MGRFNSYYGELKICAIFYMLISPAGYDFYQEPSEIMAFADSFSQCFQVHCLYSNYFQDQYFIPYVAWTWSDAVFKRNSLHCVQVSDPNWAASTVTSIMTQFHLLASFPRLRAVNITHLFYFPFPVRDGVWRSTSSSPWNRNEMSPADSTHSWHYPRQN